MADTAIFDVDGTLVDTNYQHALAWCRAMRRFDITRPMWRIHRGIGMGGDLFVSAVPGREAGVLQVFDSLVAFRCARDGSPLARAGR